MSGKDLCEGMSYVDERFVDEAETRMIPQRSVSPWMKVASMAACLCLIVFGLFNLNHYLNRGETEGAAGDSAADQAWPGDGAESGMESEMEQDSQESIIIAPEDSPAEDVPSVILRVDELTDIGFTGTVAQLWNTDAFEIGMELNVVLESGTRADSSTMDHENTKMNYGEGSLVHVQFISYDEETNTIVVSVIDVIEEPIYD